MAGPEELKGREGDMLVARVATPIVLAMIYGIYEFFKLGFSTDNYLYTYTPLVGGLVAVAGLMTYYFVVLTLTKRSWKGLLIFLGFLPYVFLLYVIGFLGLYKLYQGAIGFSIWSAIAGLVWVLLGYGGISQFSMMTDIVARHRPA